MEKIMRKILFGFMILLVLGSVFVYLINYQTSKQKPAEAETTTISQKYEQAQFKNHQLATPDLKIQVTSARFIPAGEPGNETGQQPVFAIWYETTNLSSQSISCENAWKSSFVANQTIDGKTVSLAIAAQPDPNFDGQAEIKPGHRVANAIAYQMQAESGIDLIAHYGNNPTPIGHHVYQIAK